jgi:DNA modification methylase
MQLGPYKLGYDPADDNAGIYTGDARELSKAIPDESVDLIFTDPVYDRIDDYRWLAETAARVLKVSGNLLVWSNGRWNYQNTNWLDWSGLVYKWNFCVLNNNFSSRFDGKIISKTDRVIWYGKTKKRYMYDHIADGMFSIGGYSEIARLNYKWNKPDITNRKFIESFSENGAVIFDPFTGGGTVPAVCKQLNRPYLAFEIEPDVADMARERVHATQPPLFVPENSQPELFE